MNLSNSPPSAPNGQTPRSTAARGDGPPHAQQRGSRDAFERALNAKALPLATGKQESTATETTMPDGAMPMMAWVCLPLVRTSEAPPPAAAVVETATGTRAAIETALQNAAPQDSHPLAAAERPAVWEASIGGLHGTVEVRAERIVANGVPPSWGVTIGAPAFGADVAARHTSKLHERLRKHGIDVDHVRIERKRDRDDLPR